MVGDEGAYKGTVAVRGVHSSSTAERHRKGLLPRTRTWNGFRRNEDAAWRMIGLKVIQRRSRRSRHHSNKDPIQLSASSKSSTNPRDFYGAP